MIYDITLSFEVVTTDSDDPEISLGECIDAVRQAYGAYNAHRAGAIQNVMIPRKFNKEEGKYLPEHNPNVTVRQTSISAYLNHNNDT